MAGETILVVDDVPNVLSMNVLMLQMAGYKTLEAKNLDEAKKLLGQADGLLTDKDYPRDGSSKEVVDIGLELVLHAKSQGFKGPMIMVSGKALSTSLPGASDLDEFFAKPYSLAQVVKALADAFAKRQSGPSSGGVAPGQPIPRHMQTGWDNWNDYLSGESSPRGTRGDGRS